MHDRFTVENLRELVHSFYANIRADNELGPIFNDIVHDWPEHLEQLTQFWASVMLKTGSYSGQPVPKHFKHKDRITPDLFQRWLGIWCVTTNSLFTADAANALQDRANRIAESLQLALFFRDNAPWNRPVR